MSAELLTTAEAADRLGLTMRAVQKMIEAGRLEARKVGRDYLIDPAALANIQRRAAGRPPKASAEKAAKAGRKALARWENEGGATPKATKKGMGRPKKTEAKP